MDAHRPVLLAEVLEQLDIKTDGVYVDGTFGRGGHAHELLGRLGSGGRLLAFDRDPEAVAAAHRAYGDDSRFTIKRGSFSMLERAAQDLELNGRVDGVLVDLGVSSPQLDDAQRGFSFSADGPLDMRMDPEAGPSAAEWLAVVNERELARVLYEYGEERHSRRIARAIVRQRETGPLCRTGELAALVARCIPSREKSKHPATRTFQAIRIAINGELDELESFLEQCPRVLRPGGRLCAITFHSLEDRMVKRFLRGPVEHPGPRGLPPPAASGPRMRAVGKPIRASAAETAANPRARSATLRVGERAA